MIETINKIVRTSRQMLNEIGREPTPEELAEKLGMPLEKVRKVLKIAKEPLSLETPVGDEEDSHLGDFIEDKNAILPIDAAIQSNLRETTTRVLASLTPREERVLAHALRHRHEHRPHAGRSRPAVQRDARTYSPDRGEGAAEAEASVKVTEAAVVPGQLIPIVIAGLDPAIHRTKAAGESPPFLFSRFKQDAPLSDRPVPQGRDGSGWRRTPAEGRRNNHSSRLRR